MPKKLAQEFAAVSKAISYQWLPTPIYRIGSDVRRAIRDYNFHLRLAARFITDKGIPDLFIHFGTSLGDDLLCTAVLRELRERSAIKIAMVSNHPELFFENHDVSHVVPLTRNLESFAQRWGRDYRTLEYAHWDGDDQSEVPKMHIIAELCARAGIEGRISLRPYLALTEEEIHKERWARDLVVVQSSGLAGQYSMLNKQWYPDRYQAVVNALRGQIDFLQLGSKSDPLLEYVRDYRGVTGIRQSATILHHARLYIGSVGFLMHLARSVECPSVIVYGGREAPWQSGYTCNANLYTPTPCSPCWRFNRCDFDRKCMDAIEPEDVVRAVKEMMAKPRNPLAVQTMELGAFSE
jgi:hypothetical protein